MSTSLALILTPESPCPVQEVSRIIARHLGQIPADVAGQVRYGGGVLVPLLPAAPLSGDSESVPASLDRLTGELADLGVETRAVAAETVSGTERPRRITRLEQRDETLWARLPNQRELPISREHLRGFQIHAVEAEKPLSPATEEPPADDPRRLAEAVREVGGSTLSERGLRLLALLEEEERPLPDLFLTLYPGPDRPALRLERAGFDYSILGDSKQPHSLDNFLGLIDWIAANFPRLVNIERGIRFLETLDLESITIDKPEEATGFDRWMRGWLHSEELAAGELEELRRDPWSDPDFPGDDPGSSSLSPDPGDPDSS